MARLGLILALAAMASAAATAIMLRVLCEVPLGEPCGTDTECACLHGED
jgi:hypothetical protein